MAEKVSPHQIGLIESAILFAGKSGHLSHFDAHLAQRALNLLSARDEDARTALLPIELAHQAGKRSASVTRQDAGPPPGRSVDDFLNRFRGVPAPKLWRVLNTLTPATDWNQSTKLSMATFWATGYAFPALVNVTLDDIDAALKRS